MSGKVNESTLRDKLLRERLIDQGVIRPWTNELDPIQLPPGTRVFRIHGASLELS